MSMRSKRGRGVILGAVNVAVVLGAAMIINSKAAIDVAPSYSSSFDTPDDPDFAFATDVAPRASAPSTPAAAPAKGSSDSSASVAGPSISSVPTTDSPAIEGEPILDQLWYAETPSASAAFPSLLDDSSSWPGLGGSPVTSWGTPQPTAGGSSSRGRYAGGFGGGGSSSGGGGAGGGQSNSRSGSADPVATAAALRRSADGSTAALADASSFGSLQSSATFPQGNPFSGGGLNMPTGLAFPLVQFPGNGPGAVPPGLASANLTQTTQSTVTTLQTPVSVPEPASVLLFGTALTLGVAYRSRRRLKK